MGKKSGLKKLIAASIAEKKQAAQINQANTQPQQWGPSTSYGYPMNQNPYFQPPPMFAPQQQFYNNPPPQASIHQWHQPQAPVHQWHQPANFQPRAAQPPIRQQPKKSRKRPADGALPLDLEEMDDESYGAFSVRETEYGKEVLVDQDAHADSPKRAKKKKRKTNKYACGSTSEESDSDVVKNQPYSTLNSCKHFYPGLICKAPLPDDSEVIVDFDEPSDSVTGSYTRAKTIGVQFEQLAKSSLQDQIEANREQISQMNLKLNLDKSAHRIAPDGNYQSLYTDIYHRNKEICAYETAKAGKWNDDEDQRELLLKLVDQLGNACESIPIRNSIYVFPDYWKYFVKSTKGLLKWDDRFKQTIEQDPRTSVNVVCWKALFCARLTCYPDFTVEKAASLYDDVLDQFARKRYVEEARVDYDVPKMDQLMKDIVVYRCRLDIETGSIGRVVAVLQALAEFHYHCPESLSKKPFDMRFDHLVRFYDNGLPRFGEQNAVAWNTNESSVAERNARRQQELGAFSDALEHHLSIEDQLIQGHVESGHALGKIWTDAEVMRSENFWQPLKFNHTNQDLQNDFIDIRSFKCVLEAIRDKGNAHVVVLRLLQLLGANFGTMPIKVNGQILENELFSNLVLSELPDVFNEFKRNYDGMCDYLISFMLELCNSSSDQHSLQYHLVTGILETLRKQFIDSDVEDPDLAWERVRQQLPRTFPAHRTHFNAHDFVQVKLLELEVDIATVDSADNPDQRGYPSDWVSLGDASASEFARSTIMKRLLQIVTRFGSFDNVLDKLGRSIILYAALQIVKRLESTREPYGDLRELKPFYSRARFIVLFLGVAPRKFDAFEDRDFLILERDTKSAVHKLAKLFDNETFDESPPTANVIGSSKDLLLQLYNIAYFEHTGQSLYNEFYFNHEASLKTAKEEEKKDIKTDIFFKSSWMMRFNRLDMCEKLAQKGVVRFSVYNSWALALLKKHPFVPVVWRCALHAIKHNHRLKEFLPANDCCDSVSARQSALHALLVFITKYKHYEGEDRMAVLRHELKNAVSWSQELPLPDSTAARLCILNETHSGGEQSDINQLYKEVVKKFPYAKACSFDVLPGFAAHERNKLEGVWGMLQRKGYKIFTNMEDIENRMIGAVADREYQLRARQNAAVKQERVG